MDHSAWPGQAAGSAGTKQAVAEGDHVATRETWRGTHAPTGQRGEGVVMHFFMLRNGKIVDEWSPGWDWLEPLMAA